MHKGNQRSVRSLDFSKTARNFNCTQASMKHFLAFFKQQNVPLEFTKVLKKWILSMLSVKTHLVKIEVHYGESNNFERHTRGQKNKTIKLRT